MTPKQPADATDPTAAAAAPATSAEPGTTPMAAFRVLCKVEELPESDAKGFAGAEGSFSGLLAVRRGGRVFVYQNACPHIGTPLDWMPDQFMSDDRRHLICATHGAEFTIDTGECISGPCRGDYLQKVKSVIRDGTVFVPLDD